MTILFLFLSLLIAGTPVERALLALEGWQTALSDSFDHLDTERWQRVEGKVEVKNGWLRLEKNARLAYVGDPLPTGEVVIRFQITIPVEDGAGSNRSIFAPLSPVYEYDWGLVLDMGATTLELSLDGALIFIWDHESAAPQVLASSSAARIPVEETHTVTVIQKADTISVWLDEHFALTASGAPEYDGGLRLGSWRNRVLIDDLEILSPPVE
jgi:hypothetical protein